MPSDDPMFTTLRTTKLTTDGEHFYEHDEKEDVLPWREWIRQNLPGGRAGFTFEDVDGLAAIHGPLATHGEKFMLLEFKWWHVRLDLSQARNLKRVHELLRKGDPLQRVYRGFYIVEWQREVKDAAMESHHARVNYHHVLHYDELKEFFLFQRELPSYFEKPFS